MDRVRDPDLDPEQNDQHITTNNLAAIDPDPTTSKTVEWKIGVK